MCYRRSDCYIVLILFACAALSLLTAVPMFILTYPGDECLLFISVRGEALIYGNPVGCQFISYGHCVVLLGVGVSMYFIFSHRRKGFVKRDPKDTVSNRSLAGTFGPPLSSAASMSNYSTYSSVVSRVFRIRALLCTGALAAFTLITALVLVGGYVTTCDELHYETKRQLYGRATLGTPIKDLSISCYSLFRDTDFHARFHFDHYEYSGQWHGQYRGYQHGRVHQYENKHEHVISVALALELCLAGAWIGALMWFSLVLYLTYLRYLQKNRRARELAESIEDARIYASSKDVLGMSPMTDGMSVNSQQSSSILSAKPSMISSSTVRYAPDGSSSPAPMPAADGTANPNGVQYVMMANGVLAPIPAAQQQPQAVAAGQPTVPYVQVMVQPQQPQMVPDQAQLAAPQQPQMTAQQHQQQLMQANGLAQQQQLLEQQQHQLQQLQHQLVEQQLEQQRQQSSRPVSMNSMQVATLRGSNSLLNPSGADEADFEIPNNHVAQKKQVNLSNDVGLKCSQI